MKKVVFTDQLDLGKEIIANLTEEQLQEIEGGAAQTDGSCTSGNGSCVIIVVTTQESQAAED
jgi:bacteriocin-like protein